MVVNITLEHIKEQLNPCDSQSCAIYLALKELYNNDEVHVLQDYIHIGPSTFDCSPELFGWQMKNIYNTDLISPITLFFNTENQSVGIVSGVEYVTQ